MGTNMSIECSFDHSCSPEKNSYKKNDFPVIFWSFSAADGQMSGQMSIQLTYLSRAFHVLSIDMSCDPKRVFLIFGVVTPPGGGVTGRPWPILINNMKI